MDAQPQRRQNRRHRLQLLGAGALLLVAGGVLGGLIAHNVSVSAARPPAPARAGTAPTISTAPAAVASALDEAREQAINRVSPAIVEVQNVGVGLGSGIILRQDGYIVTNDHVVANGTHYAVMLPNGATLTAHVVGTDPNDDLAVVKIAAQHLPTATLGNSAAVQVGQSVVALGNPLGIVGTATGGLVSALDRTVNEGKGGGQILGAIQTSAAINPGNSGGALLDLSGRVIGVPTLTAIDPEFNSPANGVGFAIPASTVQRIVPQLIQYGRVLNSGRPYLGIQHATVTPALQRQYHLPVSSGVLVAGLAAHGPAQQAGLTPGDVIVTFNATAITSYDDLLTALANEQPGERVRVSVVHPSGQHQTYTITLSQLPINGNGYD